MALENDYEIVCRLGEGAFGKVYKAKHKTTGDLVAVKQIKLGSKSWDEALKSTELAALRALRHPFIVRLRELIRSQLDGSLYYIFEFICSDICRLIRRYPQGMDEGPATELQRQIFAGLAHIHQYNFFHRDIKPENILYEDESATVRIADFGEARSLRARPPFTDYVGTRWYRAPECLLRDRSYSSPVDVWAAGLVYAELLRGSPVFCGNSSIDQLFKIFQVLGQPLGDWPEFARLADGCRFRVPEGNGCGLQRVLPKSTSSQVQALMAEVLRLNPRRRPLARKCLEHAVFSRCPPLDFERMDAFRNRQQSFLEDRADTCRSQASTATTAPVGGSLTPVPDEGRESSAFDAPRTPPRTPPEMAAPRVPTPPTPEPPARGAPPAVSEDSDLDLDAELDKILEGGPKSPVAKAAATAAACTPPAAARPLDDERRASAEAPQGPAPSLAHGSVEDLLDSLCADLGGEDLPARRSSHALESRLAATPGAAAAGAQLEALPPALAPQPLHARTTVPRECTLSSSQDLHAPRSNHAPESRLAATPSAPTGPAAAGAQLEAVSPGLAAPQPVQARAALQRECSMSSSQEGEEVAAVAAPLRRPSGSPTLSRQGSTGALGGGQAAGRGGGPPDAWGGGHLGGQESEGEIAVASVVRRSTTQLDHPPDAGTMRADAMHSSLSNASTRRPASAAAARGGRHGTGGSSIPDAPLTAMPARSRIGKAPSDLAGFNGDPASKPAATVLPAFQSRSIEEAAFEAAERHARRSAPWTAEESAELRRVVKRIARRGLCDKEALWVEVSRELGGVRGPKECKQQYTRDYKAHKAAAGGNGGAPLEEQPRRSSSEARAALVR